MAVNYAVRALGGSVPNYAISTVAYVIRVGGIVQNVFAGSLKADLAIGRRSTASFSVWAPVGTVYQDYQQVSIADQNGLLVFSGYATTVEVQKPGKAPLIVATFTCTDQHYLADKRIFGAGYANVSPGQIVQDVVTKVLSQEGVTLGQVWDGLVPYNEPPQGLFPSATLNPGTVLYPSDSLFPGGTVVTIPSVLYNWLPVNQVLDDLAQKASAAGLLFYWAIDQYKKLYFVPYTAIVNPLAIDGSWIDQKNNNAKVTWQSPKYRNKEFLWGGSLSVDTAPQVQTGRGDGNTREWTLNFAVSGTTPPSAKVNGIAKTMGIKSVDAGKDFYYAVGDPKITQDSAGVTLSVSDTYEFDYIGLQGVVAVNQDNAKIAAQARIEGTSGIVEVADKDTTINDLASAFAEIDSLLARYGTHAVQLQLNTMTPGYAPGQLVTVDLPDLNLPNQQMLIESVSIADSDGMNIWYTVNAIQGAYDSTWVQFFGDMINPQQSLGSITVSNGTAGQNTSGSSTQTFTGSLSLSATLSGTGISSTSSSGKIQLYKFGDNTNSNSSLNSPGIKGSNILLYWVQMEPSEGSYNWSLLDGYISAWGGVGKKIILRISACGQSGWAPPYSAQGTPSWVFSAGVQKYTNSGGDVVPQYWNPTFLNKLSTFISALGARYDGNPNIAFIQCAVGMGGECTPDTRSSDSNRLSNLQKIGYTDAVWFDTEKKIMAMYASAFPRTPLCMIPKGFLGGTSGYDERMLVNYIFTQKIFGLQNDGIGDKSGYIKPDPTWTQAKFISAEQRNKTSTTGDSLDADIQAMIAYCQTSNPAYGLLFSADIDAYPSIVSKYA